MEKLKNIIIWLLIASALIAGYAYKDDILNSKFMASLNPSSGATNADNSVA